MGKTGLLVSEVALGGIPIQRRTKNDAVRLVRDVISMGVNFIDTAWAYTDSEEKIGEAINAFPREELVIASKSPAPDKKTFLEHLETSLERLKTSYIDIYHHHFINDKEKLDAVLGQEGAWQGMLEAKEKGLVRHSAFSSHNLDAALLCLETEKFEVMQIPLNFVDDQALKEVIPKALSMKLGIIAMKPLGGGLLDDAELCFKFMKSIEGIIPDPGIQQAEEMREIIGIIERSPVLTGEDRKRIETIKLKMGDSWCHRCEYCQPCPEDIPISRMLILETIPKRFPREQALELMMPAVEKAEGCTECGVCMERCPYELKIPDLLKELVRKAKEFQKTGVWPE